MIRTESRWATTTLRQAVTIGLLTGVGEASVRLGARYVGGRMQIHSNLDVLWMAPLANGIVFSIVAFGLIVLVLPVGRRAGPVMKVALVTGALAALAAWSLTERIPQIGRGAGALLGTGVGVFVVQWLARRRATADAPRTVLERLLWPLALAVTLIAGVVTLGGAVRERRALGALPDAAQEAPNVLLLILDTVRAQSTSVHGYARATTPRIAALADSGVRFDQAWSTAPWTLPSHASIFTGRYSNETSAGWLTPLDAADLTLAERFRDAGYATAGFVGNYMTSREVGLARGFLHYEDYQRTINQLAMHAALTSWLLHWPPLRRALRWYEHVNRRTAEGVNAGVLHWIRARRERPYFAFVNYFDAHEFYLPPKPFATMFGPDTARKNDNIGFSMPNGGIAFRADKEAMQPHEIQAELDAYEGAIAYIDASIGALLDSLRAADALENTIVVVTSDHGEHFGEHGEFDHGATLYPQVLHVPLVITAPGRAPAGARVSERVTLRDLAATIEHIALGTQRFPGTSLQVYWDGDSTTRSSSRIYATRTIAQRDLVADTVRHGAWGAVVDDRLVIEFVGGRDPATRVYDLRTDPLGLSEHVIGPDERPPVDSARALYRGIQWLSRQVRAKRGH